MPKEEFICTVFVSTMHYCSDKIQLDLFIKKNNKIKALFTGISLYGNFSGTKNNLCKMIVKKKTLIGHIFKEADAIIPYFH